MKFLFDQNLSHKLVERLEEFYPNSSHVSYHELSKSDDFEVREFAKNKGFTIVTQDSDFYDIAIIRGIPPKVIWIKSGNSATSHIEYLLLKNKVTIQKFEKDNKSICLELI
ncbi:DUF5615 family PIN-like protein [Reichenbachiella sp. MALMAid0571]|uniref:DUF5615 family PIN-like protein n=1 Tax=Reichenbachiella sp. MALMAid0571 TaxID=3143939 RepID=UPI0032DF7D15